MRTSYSAIATYLQCPRRYQFQEIERIRAPKSKEAIFGTLIHRTLKFMFERNPLFPTLDEVISYFREHWPSREIFDAETRHDPLKRSWTPEEEKIYFEEGIKMLKRFYEKNAPWNFSIVDLESRFDVLLEDEKTGETHVLAGIIDRIDKLYDETYEIVDYKTSKRMPSQDAVEKDLQLSLYALGLQKRWPHLVAGKIKLSLYFLKHGEKLSTEASAETTERAKQFAVKTIRAIQEHARKEKPFEPMPSALCNWCGYRPLCPAWRHLYKKNQGSGIRDQDEIGLKIKEYFELQRQKKRHEGKIAELQQQFKDYMEQEGITRVFDETGIISKKTVERYQYDFEKIKSVLVPLGKWEEVLKADETKLRRIMKEIPEDARRVIEETKTVAKQYIALTASEKKSNGNNRPLA